MAEQQKTAPTGKKPRPDGQKSTAARKPRPAASRPEGQRPAAPRKPRPAASRPEGQRPAAPRRPRPAGNRPNPAKGAVQQKRRPGTKRSIPQRAARRIRSTASDAVSALEIRRFSTLMFLIFAVIYILILSMIIRSAVKKEKAYLGEYEASRPQYLIEEYIASLTDDFLSEMAEQAVGAMELSQYETPELLLDSVMQTGGTAGYSYRKTADFTESQPSYYILRGEEAVAAVALNRSGWTQEYGFPVWSLGEPESVMQVEASPAYTVSVTVPQGATVKLNGVSVPQELFTDAPSELQLTPTEQYFMQQPVSQSCEITGLYHAPTVEAADADGNVLEPEAVPDPTRARQEYVFAHADTKNPDEALVQTVENLTHAYIDYVMNKNNTIELNLAVMRQYMMQGSALAVLMQTIYSDVWYNNPPDLREDHVFEVRHVRMYAENLCTVDVRLELTFGKVAVNDYAGTVRWVLVNNGYGWYATNIELLP